MSERERNQREEDDARLEYERQNREEEGFEDISDLTGQPKVYPPTAAPAPPEAPQDGRIPRCQERHFLEGQQCELREGHDKMHVAGQYCWPVVVLPEKPAAEPAAPLCAEDMDPEITPLCANHAETWFCERNHIKTKSGCIACDVQTELATLRQKFSEAKAALRAARKGLRGPTSGTERDEGGQ